MNCVGIIPARYESSRFPGKPLVEILGKPIVNTAVLGGFAAKTGLVSLNSLLKAIDEVFEGELAEKNKKALGKVYNSVK